MKLERAGVFLADLVSWRVKESTKTSSVGVAIEFRATDELFGDEWSPMSPATAFGDFWVIGKDGAINQRKVDSLRRSIGWTGRFGDIVGDPPSVRVRIKVEPEDYQGKTYWKVRYVDPAVSDNEDAEKPADVAKLDEQFGSKLQQAMARKGKP
ncbi:MAG: hypothetical protein RIR41_1631, partial [Pseudomonadota bacterium]